MFQNNSFTIQSKPVRDSNKNANEHSPTTQIIIHNNSDTDITDMKLCFSLLSPVDPSTISNATIISMVGSYVELSPCSYPFEAHTTWSFTLAYPLINKSFLPASPFLFVNKDDTKPFFPVCLNTPKHLPQKTKSRTTKSAPHDDFSHHISDTISIIPQPNMIKNHLSSQLQYTDICLEQTNIKTFHHAYSAFKLFLKDFNHPVFIKESTPTSNLDVPLCIIEKSMPTNNPKESYEIIISPEIITISAEHSTGFLYALMSLFQLTSNSSSQNATTKQLPLVEIYDTPRFGWRGFMLDTVRQFYSVIEIKRIIRILALHKCNKFQWHITDDEAWRVELSSYPQLTEKFAHRGYNQAIPPFFGSGYEKSGGIYSKQDIQEIITYADMFSIEVIPEFDIPGHSYALMKALPELIEEEDRSTYTSIQGYHPNALNPGLPASYTVVNTIIKEISDLFFGVSSGSSSDSSSGSSKGSHFHYGCDERSENAWKESPACHTLMKEKNIASLDELQTYFVQNVERILHKETIIPMAWEEAATQGDIDINTIVCVWKGVESGELLLKKGHRIILCPGQYYYLDMAQSSDENDIGMTWAGIAPLEKVYDYEPVPQNMSHQEKVLGIQATLFSENMWDKTHVDYMMFPRLAAIAESAWTHTEQKSLSRFIHALHNMYYPLLKTLDIGSA